MALFTQKGQRDIPKDAVLLSENEAYIYQKSIISSWKYPADVFWLKYGPGILAIGSFGSSLYLNHYYRYKLRLGSFGRFAAYLPAVIIPSFTTTLTHELGIQRRVIVDKFTCSTCLEIRAVLLQVASSIIYPCFLTPILGFMLASRYHTYNVPEIHRDPKNTLKLYLKFTKPIVNHISIFMIVNMILAIFVTHKEGKSVATIREKLLAFEKEIQ